MTIQLRLFNSPHVKKSPKAALFQTLSTELNHQKTPAEELLSERYISQNGMLLLRQKISTAYRQGDIKTYLMLVRFEIDLKKGRITLGQALKQTLLKSGS